MPFEFLTYVFEPLQFLVIFRSDEQSDIMPNGIVVFSHYESDIIFAEKLGEAQYHSALAEYHCEAI